MSWRSQCFFKKNTLPKFNSSPLKSHKIPIGSRIVFPVPPFFRGNSLLNFGGVDSTVRFLQYSSVPDLTAGEDLRIFRHFRHRATELTAVSLHFVKNDFGGKFNPESFKQKYGRKSGTSSYFRHILFFSSTCAIHLREFFAYPKGIPTKTYPPATQDAFLVWCCSLLPLVLCWAATSAMPSQSALNLKGLGVSENSGTPNHPF